MCDVDEDAVVNAVDVPSIYDLPKLLNDQGLDQTILNHLELCDTPDVDWSGWQPVLDAVHQPKHEVTIGLIGKYIDLHDAYLSVSEALRAGGFPQATKVKLEWIQSDRCATPEGAREALGHLDGICVPGGFGIRGIEGKIGALKFARENDLPTLGLCLGMQCMVIEYARNVAGVTDATSSEFAEAGEGTAVIATMEEQIDVLERGDMGGTMRLGLYDAVLAEGSQAAATYGATEVSERHRHRYEVNNPYRDQIAAAGLNFSGLSPDGQLVEFVEVTEHPFYVGTQAHPELKSRPSQPHPLFVGLVRAALERQQSQRLVRE